MSAVPTPGESLQLYILLLLILLLAMTTAMTVKQMNDLKRLQMRRRPKLFTVIEECDGKTTTRDFRDGDYVGLVLERCQGGGLRRVIGIYAVPEEKKKGPQPI